MTNPNLSLRQRLRLGAGQSVRAWQRSLSQVIRDHFDDLEEHVRVGFRYAQILNEIEAVRLEQFVAELDQRERVTKARLLVHPKDQAALAQLLVIAGFRQTPPFQLIKQRSFGEALYLEREKRKKAGTYHFSEKRIVLPGVRAPQLFVDFDDTDLPLQISHDDTAAGVNADVSQPVRPDQPDPASQISRGERPVLEAKSAAAKHPSPQMPATETSDPASTDKRSQPPVAPVSRQSQAIGAGKPAKPNSSDGTPSPAPDPARIPAPPATEAPGPSARTSSLSRRPSGPTILEFD